MPTCRLKWKDTEKAAKGHQMVNEKVKGRKVRSCTRDHQGTPYNVQTSPTPRNSHFWYFSVAVVPMFTSRKKAPTRASMLGLVRFRSIDLAHNDQFLASTCSCIVCLPSFGVGDAHLHQACVAFADWLG